MTNTSRIEGHYRARRSLVRKFVSLIPEFVWKRYLPTPQIYFHPLLLGKDIGRSSMYSSDEDDPNSSFKNFSSYLSLSNKKPDLILNSTPKPSHCSRQDAKITALQRELQILKEQITKIMEQQLAPSSGYVSSEPGSTPDKHSPVHFVPPPPPLPPPAAIPAQLLLKTSTPVKSVPKRLHNTNVALFGGDLLKDLDKVKLRRIDKSPGGGPKKAVKASNDPGDFLQEVLRKRFLVIQNLSPETTTATDPNESLSKQNDNFVSHADTPSAASE